MKENTKRIGVLCPYWFPEGMAATTRILAYSKGLVKNGLEVEVICFFPKVVDDPNPDEGTIDGVSYLYLNHRDPKASKIRRILYDRPRSIWNTIKYIKRQNKQKRYSSILLSFDDPIWLLAYALPLKLLGITTVFIGDEFPEPIRKFKSKIPYIWEIGYKIAYVFIDKRVLMTEALRDFYDKIVKKPAYIMSSVLDDDRFNVISPHKQPYLCYMGNMALDKDNVDSIIRAFALVAHDFPSYELRLYGKPRKVDEEVIINVIKESGVEKQVSIKGWVNYAEVPRILAEASILVTSQPNTKRAEGGFPTKMGEYMMSKSPMIVTNVGEICEYVQDGITTYMVEPEDPIGYSKKIRFILTHPEETQQVASNAYQYACKEFGCKSVTFWLSKFLS